MPELRRAEPPYLQIFRYYRAKIVNGELMDGDLLPSGRQLRDEWGIAKATANRVSAALQNEGLVESVPGKGLVVTRRNRSDSAADRVMSVRRTGKIYPPGQRARIIEARVVPAPDQVARALGIQSGEPVISRKRLTLQDETPISLSTSYHPGYFADLAPQLLTLERIKAGTGYWEEKTGKRTHHVIESTDCRQPTTEEIELLRVPEGEWVNIGRNTMTAEDGEVLEYGESVRLSGRWRTAEYVIPAPEQG